MNHQNLWVIELLFMLSDLYTSFLVVGYSAEKVYRRLVVEHMPLSVYIDHSLVVLGRVTT